MPIRSAVFALALAIVLPASVAQGKSKLEFAYVVLGAQGAVARAVYTDATTCPSVALAARSGKSTQPMSVRALPQSADASGQEAGLSRAGVRALDPRRARPARQSASRSCRCPPTRSPRSR